jgi:hypothetical protein
MIQGGGAAGGTKQGEVDVGGWAMARDLPAPMLKKAAG